MVIIAREVIDVGHRLPGDFHQPHTSYHLIFCCHVVGGEPRQSSETINYGYFSSEDIIDWHRDHKEFAERAWRFWAKRKGEYPSFVHRNVVPE